MLTRYGYTLLIAGVLMFIAGAWETGFSTATPATRTGAEKPIAGTPELERLRKQVAVLDAQRYASEAALAEALMRVQVLKNLTQRYQEELAYVDGQLESLKGGEK